MRLLVLMGVDSERYERPHAIHALRFGVADVPGEARCEMVEMVTVPPDVAAACRALLSGRTGARTVVGVPAIALVCPGAVVRLNSGGPEMTVGGISSDGLLAECWWYDDRLLSTADTGIRQGAFPTVALKVVPPVG